MITPENLPIHELIGLRVRVVKSRSGPRTGLEGIVVDETKNTLVLDLGGREAVVPKIGSTFRFTLPSKKRAEVEGERIAYRPHDRIKKVKLD